MVAGLAALGSSYDVAVTPDRAVTLVCTFRGSEGRLRIFDILVDGQKTATVTLPYHPTELLDMEYAISEAMTRGKQKVTVRFQSHADAATAAVFEVRVVPSAKWGVPPRSAVTHGIPEQRDFPGQVRGIPVYWLVMQESALI